MHMFFSSRNVGFWANQVKTLDNRDKDTCCQIQCPEIHLQVLQGGKRTDSCMLSSGYYLFTVAKVCEHMRAYPQKCDKEKTICIA